jgi:glycosyltransferase involved in cell wall biosynthesis
VGRIDGWVKPEHQSFVAGVRARAAMPDLRGHVDWLGFREDVPALMAQSGVHCLPSRPEMYEGFGIVTVEAKQAGIPSVAFDIGPSRELIEPGLTGTLCAPIDAPSLAAGLETWLRHPERLSAMADAIRASAQPYSREAFRAGWLDVFLGEHSARAVQAFDVGPAGVNPGHASHVS